MESFIHGMFLDVECMPVCDAPAGLVISSWLPDDFLLLPSFSSLLQFCSKILLSIEAGVICSWSRAYVRLLHVVVSKCADVWRVR